MKLYTNYILFAIIVFLIDMIYIFSISNYFKKVIKRVQKTPLYLNKIGAAVCYLVITLGMYYFIIISSTKYCYTLLCKKTHKPVPKALKTLARRPPKRLSKIIHKKYELARGTQISGTPSGTPSDSSASIPLPNPFFVHGWEDNGVSS